MKIDFQHTGMKKTPEIGMNTETAKSKPERILPGPDWIFTKMHQTKTSL